MLKIRDLDFVKELDNEAAAKCSGGNTLRWVSASGGRIPRGAVIGGFEPGRPRLYICRASYKGGRHPGKVVGKNCNFGYGGREILKSNYQVLTHNR